MCHNPHTVHGLQKSDCFLRTVQTMDVYTGMVLGQHMNGYWYVSFMFIIMLKLHIHFLLWEQYPQLCYEGKGCGEGCFQESLTVTV